MLLMPELNCCPSQLIICKVSGSTWKTVFFSKEIFCIKRSATSSSRKPSLIAGAQLRALLWKMSSTHLWFSTCHSSIKISRLQSWLFRVRDHDIFISVPPALTGAWDTRFPVCALYWASAVCYVHISILTRTASIARPKPGLWRDLHHAPLSKFSHL